ncbi:MAG: glycoside hydrolase family 9 protein [Oscillospiraceae bacterium]|jgi:endoglucanase|nr:glycoside hydrolase family 9 protein [Oscillospiraceae bacterium]
MNNIRLDQMGYRPGDVKKAVVPETASGFQVVRVSDRAVLYEGNASEPMLCAASHEKVRIADFTAVTQSGEYRLETEEGSSYPFFIGDTPYGGLRKAVLDFFHYQKCGVTLDAGAWSHPACHTTPAYVLDASGQKTGEIKDVSGGWHDAGDYGRYIVPAAQTVAQLLLAYELAPAPDAGVLDAVWFEIEWMLKMQDETAGGVYHKVSCETFNALNQMPDQERGELVLCPVSAATTADFAATMALASRFFPAQKDRLIGAAGRAWQWCLANPDAPGFQNPPNVKTGEYGDDDSQDERFWAACELFIATGDEAYHDYIKSAELSTGLGWRQMGTFGLAAYLLHAGSKAGPDLAARMKSKLLSAAQDIMAQCETSPYGISLGLSYRWGSNMDLANNAMTLLLAELFENNIQYREAALEHMHYLLGKNGLNKCYISGLGSDPMRNPHHRPSVAAGQAVPGMVSGGPNGNTKADLILHKHCAGLPPMKCYVDHIESCASNEIAIYWNSPVYFVLAVLGL